MTGGGCQATVKIGKVRKQTSLRARAFAIDGYKAANSPVRTVKVKKAKRQRR